VDSAGSGYGPVKDSRIYREYIQILGAMELVSWSKMFDIITFKGLHFEPTVLNFPTR
jgi:hypothetical protein